MGHANTPPQGKQTLHWQYFPQKPFTKEQRSNTTLLFGGLTFKHERLLAAALKPLKYNLVPLPTPSLKDLQAGKEYGNYGQCNPTYFTVGNLVNYLVSLEEQGMSKQEIIEKYAFVTATSPCGPCRFGMYQNEFRLALSNSGFEGFRIIPIEQTEGIDQDSGENTGIELTPQFFVSALYALIIGDLLNDLAYSLRPYEVHEGQTDEVLEESLQQVEQLLSNRPMRQVERSSSMKYARMAKEVYDASFGESFEYILEGLEAIAKKFDTIDLDRTRVRPVVKITGEFWAQTTEGDGNYAIFTFLEKEHAAVIVEPVATWIAYMIHQQKVKGKDIAGLSQDALFPSVFHTSKSWVKFFKTTMMTTIASKAFERMYNRMTDTLFSIPHHLLDQEELAAHAHEFYHTRLSGGEGHLEVGKSIYYHKNKLAHMVLSLKPFGCMPSTQSDGTQAAVQGRYGDMIFLPIETSGEGEVNAHSRVQMALGEAKEKARNEFQDALKKTGLTIEQAKKYIEKNPALKRPSYHIPKREDAVGIAANTIYHIAELATT